MNYRRIIVKLTNEKEMTFILEGKRLRSAKCGACKSGAFFEYVNNEVKCPNCGRTLEIIKTPEDFEEEKKKKEEKIQKERLENLHLVECGMDYSTGIKMYCLSTKVDPDIWMKIRGFFNFYNKGWDNENDADFLGQTPTGWLTTMPKEVEKILMDLNLIQKENTLYMREERAAKRKAEEKKRRKMKEEARTKAYEIRKDLIGIFNEAEKPYEKELMKDGKNYMYKTKNIREYEDVLLEVIEDPLQPRGSYFGGVVYVICKKHIWIIYASDNWMCHNIQIISDNRELVGEGKRILYSKEVENKIKEYEKVAFLATH